jgi:hypothetical protein
MVYHKDIGTPEEMKKTRTHSDIHGRKRMSIPVFFVSLVYNRNAMGMLCTSYPTFFILIIFILYMYYIGIFPFYSDLKLRICNITEWNKIGYDM